METENAVKEFQRVFDLAVDGIVGPSTWYKIQFIYNAVKRLNELESEGLRLEDVSKQFPKEIRLGDTGEEASVLQYFLTAISYFNPDIPAPGLSNVYDEQTRDSIIAFQNFYGLPATGIVDDATWNYLYDDYLGIIRSLTPEQIGTAVIPFPGTFLKLGATGPDVELLQQFINTAAAIYADIPEIPLTGVYDENTRDAVYAVEAVFGYPVNGITGPLVWNVLANIYSDAASGEMRSDGQFSGNDLSRDA